MRSTEPTGGSGAEPYAIEEIRILRYDGSDVHASPDPCRHGGGGVAVPLHSLVFASCSRSR